VLTERGIGCDGVVTSIAALGNRRAPPHTGRGDIPLGERGGGPVVRALYRVGAPTLPGGVNGAGSETRVVPEVRWGGMVWRTRSESLLSNGSLVRSQHG